jgi:DNA-binding transcriptional ArsR family regulator
MARKSRLKALSDPRRTQILELLAARPMTAKQVAGKLGAKPTALYHHFAVLEGAGLIRLERTKPKRGTVEKYYRAVSEEVLIRKGGGGDLLASVLEATLAEVLRPGTRRLGARGLPGMVQRHKLRLSRSGLRSLLRLLEKLQTDLRRSEKSDGEMEYGITLAVYPTAVFKRGR